jgi:hypothetical protein
MHRIDIGIPKISGDPDMRFQFIVAAKILFKIMHMNELYYCKK